MQILFGSCLAGIALTLPSSNYLLTVYPVYAPSMFQNFEFNLYNSIIQGDLNSDGVIYVLDVVILDNLVLYGDTSNPAGDLNQDGEINVVDVVVLVNSILGEG